MYALIDCICWLISIFMIINGSLISLGSSSLFGISSEGLWLGLGLLLYFFYPFILEILYSIASSLITPSCPDNSSVIPIAYHPSYNISACGIEKLHPFDSQKYGKVFNALLLPGRHIVPSICPRGILNQIHPFYYLLSLCYSFQIFRAVEIPVCILPSWLLRWRVLNPMLYATYGSVLAGCAAVRNRKYGINLSGGYHHASSNSCGGFCIYADITITIYWVRKWFPDVVRKVMIIDLDAHQGNGHENDFLTDPDTYIIDFFNSGIYPNDYKAKRAIRCQENFDWGHTEKEYLDKVDKVFMRCIEEFKPDFILYNAGTDCMEGDPLGGMNLTADGIVIRDEIVFHHALTAKVPILMVLSGGYQAQNAPTISRSILNLNKKFKLY